MIFTRKSWIRRDREQYFLNGFILASVVASFISSYWHFLDRIVSKPTVNIQTQALTKEQEAKKIREAGYFVPKMQTGATRYYTLESEGSLPKIPGIPEEEDGE